MRRYVRLHWTPSPSPSSFLCRGRLTLSQRWCLSLRIPSIEFTAPRSRTHEDLAYASCPVCGRVVHMCDMLTHLTTAHREINPTHCRRICSERLALYERAVGVPLKKLDLTSTGRRVLDFLPTLLPGGYVCHWCETRGDVHPTRDRFLRHVADAHAEIDLEEVEAHVPPLPRAPAAGASSGPGGGTAPPTRRLAGGEAVAETVRPAAVVCAAPRAVGVSVPRSLDRPGPPAASGPLDFPCELCARAFLSEADLLQHLETRHPDGTAAGAQDEEAASVVADVAQFAAREALSGADRRICVTCDLCQYNRVYTMPSALYSHIRFKHPTQDAAFHVERLMRMQDKSPSFVCGVCQKVFASAQALEGHARSKHATVVSATAESVIDRTRASLINCWWCNECEKGFSSAKGLHGHMQGKHGLSSQSHPCPACKRIFPDIYSLEEHIGQQHKTISLVDLGLQSHASCNTCGRSFLTHEDLHRHAVKHHKKDPRAPVRPFDAPLSSPTAGAPNTATTNTTIVVEASAASAEGSAKKEPQGPRKVKRKKKIMNTENEVTNSA